MEGSLVLPHPHGLVGPDLLLPLCSPAVSRHLDPPAGPHPALLSEGGALLLVVLLLSVGDAADGAMGGASVGVLTRHLRFLEVAPVLGQNSAEAAP